ncbi:uncharacterized protein LOC121373318 isoform X2 [Gigantopelta aegis]|uniref:uncharacterized protein LOC121373318 isoform X2 n=1 Tax=Gigantopelta aegis TaxID=1735272 RepID=UPI001B88760B|nr:uncharacterized protein LOC121373318 isoform X2 [Gigantopelta aegis]
MSKEDQRQAVGLDDEPQSLQNVDDDTQQQLADTQQEISPAENVQDGDDTQQAIDTQQELSQGVEIQDGDDTQEATVLLDNNQQSTIGAMIQDDEGAVQDDEGSQAASEVKKTKSAAKAKKRTKSAHSTNMIKTKSRDLGTRDSTHHGPKSGTSKKKLTDTQQAQSQDVEIQDGDDTQQAIDTQQELAQGVEIQDGDDTQQAIDESQLPIIPTIGSMIQDDEGTNQDDEASQIASETQRSSSTVKSKKRSRSPQSASVMKAKSRDLGPKDSALQGSKDTSSKKKLTVDSKQSAVSLKKKRSKLKRRKSTDRVAKDRGMRDDADQSDADLSTQQDTGLLDGISDSEVATQDDGQQESELDTSGDLDMMPEGQTFSDSEEHKALDPLDDPSLAIHEALDIEAFNKIVNRYGEIFSDHRYLNVHDEYPAEEVVRLVTMVTDMLGKFEEFMGQSQQNIEMLRAKMRKVKDNVHTSVNKLCMNIREDEEDTTTIEKRELAEKLAALNAICAKTNVEVAEAVHLSTETEKLVVETQMLTETAREEAKWIEMELDRKTRAEAKKKAEEEKRLADEKRQEEEARRQKQAQEEAVKKMETKRRESMHPNMEEAENWTIHEYITADSCFIIKGHPIRFEKKNVRFRVLKPNVTPITFNDQHEELVSQIIQLLAPSRVSLTAIKPLDVYLAIPHLIRRAVASAREPVMKVLEDDTWVELPTIEVTFENQKDKKFAQAEIKSMSTFMVTSRFRRDYVTINKKELTLTSSYDQRVKLTFPDGTFPKEQILILTVIPVDLASVNEFRSWGSQNKRLLASSSIICTDLNTQTMKKPLAVTMSCPSNPAKARKMALARKQKEDKMNQPSIKVPIEFDEKEKGKKKKEKTEEFVSSIKSQPRWYMGEYGASDDDDTDVIYLIALSLGKWNVLPDVEITQKKAELVTFKLPKCYDKFVVVRFRTTVCMESAALLFAGLQETLSYRYARVVFRQHQDEQYQAVVYVLPDYQVDKMCNTLDEQNYSKGPPTSQRICLSEGDQIELKFRGNIRIEGNRSVDLRFHSNLTSMAELMIEEVDRYRQKNFGEHKGVVEFARRYTVPTDAARVPEVKRSFLCDLYISLPRYDVDQGGVPEMITMQIKDPLDCVNEDLLNKLSFQLGKEWQQLAHHLGVTHERVQAILRNIQAHERSETEAKYWMLLTWFKRSKKFEDKVTPLKHALLQCGRTDLAELVYDLELEFHVERFYNESPEKRESIPRLQV